MSNLIVIYDACVLYQAPIRDLLLRLVLADLYRAKWTHDIHEEWINSLLKKRPDLTRAHLEKIRDKMDKHVRDCLVVGYKGLIKDLVLPDPEDRHVLAAAIRAGAQMIITFNLADFPSKTLLKYGVEAQHPDLFLRYLLDRFPSRVIDVIRETRMSLKSPAKSAQEYLSILERQALPQTVKYLQDYIDLI
ncbi:PIN domain-containing protein [Candidatus Dependentiae bacterium]|jgi:hypothetical protein|nr:PIN domain-containing protein [Candidatus Dependentiae bacterium]